VESFSSSLLDHDGNRGLLRGSSDSVSTVAPSRLLLFWALKQFITWLADTSSGRDVGDYISASYVQGKAFGYSR
jgi:hypothetical protein